MAIGVGMILVALIMIAVMAPDAIQGITRWDLDRRVMILVRRRPGILATSIALSCSTSVLEARLSVVRLEVRGLVTSEPWCGDRRCWIA